MSTLRRFSCNVLPMTNSASALNMIPSAGWDGALSYGRGDLSTEQLVKCFGDNIGRPVTLQVLRGPKEKLQLRVIPQRA